MRWNDRPPPRWRLIRGRTDAYGFAGRHEQVAATLAAAGVPTVEPVGWFCTDRKRPAVIGNMLVHRDDSHISTAYSAYLAPATAPLFATPGGTGLLAASDAERYAARSSVRCRSSTKH